MSLIAWIVLGSIAAFVASTMVDGRRYALAIAVALAIASAGWAGSASTAHAPDAWITTASKVRLLANSQTPARDINVDTLGGVVTLFGTVPTEASRRAAEVEVKKVDGVKSSPTRASTWRWRTVSLA